SIFHAGNLIIIGFVCCALGMLFLAYKTTTVTYDLSVEGDYYAMETSMNQQHDAQRNSISLGNDFKLYQTADSIYITLPPRISRQIHDGNVSFYCYSNAKQDARAALEATAEGIYAFDKDTYMKGNNYNVKVSFEAGGKKYYKESRF